MSSSVAQSDLLWLNERVDAALPALATLASRGALTEAVRATAWRLFLRVVTPDAPDTWATQVAAHRARYRSLRAAAMARLDEAMRQAIPEEEDEEDARKTPAAKQQVADDDVPHAREKTTTPTTRREDDDHVTKQVGTALEDAADQIRRDLERCYPEGAGSHFVEPRRQKMMFQILLTWSHHRAQPGYRQGMHELLAPLVWTLERSFAATSVVVLPPESALRAVEVDPRYLEEDAYCLFEVVVQEFLPLYDPLARDGDASRADDAREEVPQEDTDGDEASLSSRGVKKPTPETDDAAFENKDALLGAARPVLATKKKKTRRDDDDDDARSSPTDVSFVVAACARVQGPRLAAVDADLHAHLASFGSKSSSGSDSSSAGSSSSVASSAAGHNESVVRGVDREKVLPQVYMLSWLRLGLARQTTINDTCKLWDAFFATCRTAAGPTVIEWLELAATVLLVLERTRLLRAYSAVTCLRHLLRVVAPEPGYLARHARKLHADPAAMQPLVAGLRQQAHLSHVLPAWLVALLGSLGVVAAPPKTSLLPRADSGSSLGGGHHHGGSGNSSVGGNGDGTAASYLGVFSATVLGRVLSLGHLSSSSTTRDRR